MRRFPNGSNRMIGLRRGLALGLAVVVSLGARAAAGEPDKAAQWAPADALLFVGCSNVHDLFEAMKKTPSYQQFKDPKLAKSTESTQEGVKKGLGQLVEHMGFGSLDDLEKMGLDDMLSEKTHPRGAMCLYIAAGPDQGGDKGPRHDVALLADMGEDFGKFREMFDKLVQQRLDKGGKKESTEYQDSTIVTITNEGPAKSEKKAKDDGDEGDEEKDGGEESSAGHTPPPISYAFKDKVFLLASDVEVAKQALKRVKEKQSDCLASSEDYGNLERACAPVGQIRVFVNFPQMFKLQEKFDKDKEVIETIGKMGMRDWKALVGTIRVGMPKGADVSLQMNLPLGTASKGLSKVLAMKNGPVAPPAHIDADTALLWALHLSPGQFYDDILAMMDKVDPAAAKRARADDQIPVGEKDEKMSMRNDVLGQLDAPFTLSVGMKKPFNGGSLRILATMAHKNRAAMEKLMGLLPPGMFKKREMMGQQVYDVMGLPMTGISLAMTEKLLAAGGERSVEATIRSGSGKSEALADSADFKGVARHVPKEAWFTMYVDGVRMNKFLLAMVKHEEKTEGEESGKEDQDPLSNFITSFALPMMLAQAGEAASPEVMEAGIKYSSRLIVTIGTKGDSIELNSAMVGGEGEK